MSLNYSIENIKWLQEKEQTKLDKHEKKEERQKMKDKRAVLKTELQMGGMHLYTR